MNTKTWDIDLIGVLATDEYVQANTGKYSAVFINTQNSLQFLVRLISQPPDSFPNEDLFTCYGTEIERYYNDDLSMSEDERIAALRQFLGENLIVFQPTRKLTSDRKHVYNAKNIRLLPKSDGYYENLTLVPVPVFSQKKNHLEYEEFLSRLLSKRYVGRIENISHDANDTPEFIFWKWRENEYELVGCFDTHTYAYGGFSFTYNDPIKLAKIPPSLLEDTYEVNESVRFVPLDVCTELSDLLKKEGELIHIKKPETEMKETITIQNREGAPILINELKESVRNPIHENDLENQWMNHFIQFIREEGFQYSEKDLYNFHTSMKSSRLTILSGISGTGKSKLVQLYAKALGLGEEQFKIIPVRPSWNDDADLIGYVDLVHMIYRPGDSGLVNSLIEAEGTEDRKQNKLYIICFDEMNLARVEHYFSQFLSVLEMDPPHRKLQLYNEELQNRLYNAAQFPPTVSIGDNVLFVGTVNLDESTYHFSDKVLDRANMITLDILPYQGLSQLPSGKGRSSSSSLTAEEYHSFRDKGKTIQLSEREMEFLWDLHEQMQLTDQKLGIGPRVIRQMDAYLRNLPNNPYLSRGEALDLQVVQRILTKLRGPEQLLKELIGSYHDKELVNSTFLKILDDYNDLSEFVETRKLLRQKAKELKVNGYTV